MTTIHIAAPLHHPLAAFTSWLRARTRRSPGAQAPAPTQVDLESLRQSLPLTDPHRHALEAPALEEAFANLAADHPVQVALASMRDADRQALLTAVVDDWFRHAHPAPMHRWPAAVRAEYDVLLGSVRACFDDGGAQ